MAPVTIYTSMFCSYCHAAKALLAEKGIPFREIDVTFDPDRRREMELLTGSDRKVPQVFIGDTRIGGSDRLQALAGSGELDRLLNAAGAQVRDGVEP